jgi:tetratricopeptide (TPR) repeat protein
MKNEADQLIEKAENLFKQHKLEEAFQFYNEAGILYQQRGEPMKAAEAYAEGAKCERMRTGLEPLLEAAFLSEKAAKEAVKAGNYAFARWQFREAGLLYERERDFEKYSHCFIQSQNAFLEYLWVLFATGKKQDRLKRTSVEASSWDRLSALAAAFFGFLSRLVWGYGEKPFRVVFFGGFVIFFSALAYWSAGLANVGGAIRPIDLYEAFYLSGVTFSTLGYGDIVPLGWVRWVAILESLSGFLSVPLLVIALTRRYLRVYW